jgi:deoxyribose-phosphate aldolase
MLESRAAMLAQRSLKAESEALGMELAIACLELALLEGKDTPGEVRAVCARGAAPAPGAPHVAAVCTYPSLVPIARDALAGTSVRLAAVAAVAAAFPIGLSPFEGKLREARAALAAGADEIDLVVDRGAFLAGRYDDVRYEISAVREACGGSTLKVILEAGELGSYAAIRRACDIALESGADFLETATGECAASSTPPIALLMCQALRAHAHRTGRAAGLKITGGIGTAELALGYLAIVNETLGAQWLRPERLRIGGRSLLGALLLRQRPHAARA